jgi:hypothetical protein
MNSGSAAFSARFARATEVEQDRLAGRLEKAKTKARKRKGELAGAETEVAELEAQLSALESLSATGTVREEQPGTLRGRAIREVAVGLLLHRGPDSGPIHYRTWLALLEEAGHSVAGRRPDAVFLNQVTRHPLVRSTTRAGFYELDSSAPVRLESRVAELRTSLAAAAQEAAEPSSSLTQHDSHEVSLELGRAERALA